MVHLRQAAEDVLSEHVFDYEIEGRTSLEIDAYDYPFWVAHMRLHAMPSNPFWVYSWGLVVDEDFRGVGIGQELLRLRLAILEEAGAHTYFNVVNDENEVQNHIMQKYGFEKVVGEPEDPRNTSMWAKTIHNEPQPELL